MHKLFNAHTPTFHTENMQIDLVSSRKDTSSFFSNVIDTEILLFLLYLYDIEHSEFRIYIHHTSCAQVQKLP